MGTGVSKMASEVIALLFPDPGQTREEPMQSVTALVRDDEGPVELRSLVADTNIMRRARLAGRFNCGSPSSIPSPAKSSGTKSSRWRSADRPARRAVRAGRGLSYSRAHARCAHP